MPTLLLSAVLTGVATSLMLPLVLRWLRRRELVDVPNHRSMHGNPTPRGGGIALALGMVLGLLVAGDVPWPVWLGVAGFTILGTWDDFSSKSVGIRLAAQALISAVLAYGVVQLLGAPVVLAVLATLVLISTVNAVNFMDGINGITGLHAVVWGIAYWLALESVGLNSLIPLAVTMAAAGLVFLPWNMPRARLFLGDSGSYLIGGSVGILAISGLVLGHPVAFLGPLATYAADTGFAAYRRLRNGESLTAPHRTHVFQRLVGLGLTHTQTALITAGFTAVSAGLALTTLTSGTTGTLIAVALIVLINAAYLCLPTLMLRFGSRYLKSRTA